MRWVVIFIVLTLTLIMLMIIFVEDKVKVDAIVIITRKLLWAGLLGGRGKFLQV